MLSQLSIEGPQSITGNLLSKYKRQKKQKIPIIDKFAKVIVPSTKRHRVVWGGRNKGASWQIAIYLLYLAMNRRMFIPCVRETQKSTEHSVKKILKETIERLGWEGFYKVRATKIEGANGSLFIFLGLNEQTEDSIKSIESANACWVAESQSITRSSFDKLVPSIRGDINAFIIWDLNPMRASDPAYYEFIANPIEEDVDALYLTLLDNPFDTGVLNRDIKRDFRRDSKMAAHIWLGKLLPENSSVVFLLSAVEAAMRNKVHPVDSAPIAVGADIAHKGGDEIVFYKRKGLKVIDRQFHRRLSLPECARKLDTFAQHKGYTKKKIQVAVDNGNIGAGVCDLMQEAGWNINRVNFGGKPDNEVHYANAITELYFELSSIIHYCDIPSDPELLDQLTDRRYVFVTGDKGEERMRLESKEEYQKRKGKSNASPDRADGLALTFKDALLLESEVGLLGNRY